MKKIFTLAALTLCLAFVASAQTTYTLCTSGTWLDNNTGTARFSNGGACNILPITFAAGDVMIIPEGMTLNLAKNLTIEVEVTIEINGEVMFSNGKINLTDANSTIILGPNSEISCDGSGDCGNSDQISIGTAPDIIQWKGQDIEDINNGPRPVTLTESGVMPVVLKEFFTILRESSVELSWTTIMEETFDRFIVERSGNGEHFESISEINGQGQNIYDQESNYSYIDPAPLIGFNYYRLKAVDIDNSFEYFGPVVARIKADKAMTIFPNPGEGNEITYYTNFSPEEGDRIVLRNNVGKVLYSDVSPKSFSTINLSSTRLSPGLYFLEYVGSEHKQVVRVFIK
ncbi:MAG TPA: T9SS type A sorting domain-containing protein [Chryseosolibacter sp.]|nr:T9SS type A sorting domain-containing protein [Chryseosolibacter sp.]